MKLAITGWAWRTPLGSRVDDVMTRVAAGACAATEHLGFPIEAYGCRVGARIAEVPRGGRNARFVPRLGLFAMEAAAEAFAMARIESGPRLGLFAGVGHVWVDWGEVLPALVAQADDGLGTWERGLRLIHPFWLLRHLSNNAHAITAADRRALGEGATFGGEIAGAHALVAASAALEDGAVDAALVFAYDSLLAPDALLGVAERGACTRAALASLRAPYDEAASGFVPGEGAVALVVERAADAGARALALVDAAVLGDAATDEAEAATVARAAERVARDDRVVDGAALGQPDFDRAEREAVARVVSGDASLVAITASLGHLGAAAPLAKVIALTHALRRGMLPPIAALARPSPGPLRPTMQSTTTSARSAIGLFSGVPGLACAVRVELP